MRRILCLITILNSFILSAHVKMSEELWRGGDFRPVFTRGEATAAYGWMLCDYGRWNMKRSRKYREYVDGRRCFKLDFPKGGGMEITYLSSAPDGYYGPQSRLFNSMDIDVPADSYRLRIDLRFAKGTVIFPMNIKLHGKPDWQKVDVSLKGISPSYIFFGYFPFPGMKIAMRNASFVPEYKVKPGGSINLPDGGKLTGIVFPENASDLLRLEILAWRGWLWKITGILLPLVPEKEAVGKNGMLRFTADRSLPAGGSRIKVDKNGFSISYYSVPVLRINLFRYLRRCGLRYYTDEVNFFPKTDPNRVLPAVSETFKPRLLRTSYTQGAYRRYNGAVHVWGHSAGASNDWYGSAWGMNAVSHSGNLLLPQEKFFDKHPEYYMTHADGKQHMEKNPMHVSPCYSNPDAVKTALESMRLWFKNNDFSYDHSCCLGDRPVFCQCTACKKGSTPDNYSDIYMAFMNKAAAQLPADNPDKEVNADAYLKTFAPPKNFKAADRLQVSLCVTPYSMPCQAHIECELNRKAWTHIRNWAKLFKPEKLNIVMYEEIVPIHYEERVRAINKYAKGSFHCHSAYEDYAQFFAIRYSQGEEIEDIRREYVENCFGKGAQHVLDAWKIIYDFCENYKHVPADRKGRFSVLPWVYYRRGILTRQVYDAVYAEFDKAVEAVGNDPVRRRAIFFELFKIMRGDLAKFNRGTCITQKDLNAFAKRFAKFITICSEMCKSNKRPYSTTVQRHIMYISGYRSTPAEFISNCSGIEISGKVKPWTEEPELKKLVAAPEKYFSAAVKQSNIGWDVQPIAMLGGDGAKMYSYKCAPRMCNVLLRPSSGKHQIVIPFDISKKLTAPLIMMINGLDDDKPDHSSFKVFVNNKEIFSGLNTFPEDGWGVMKFSIQPELLKVGENTIKLVNTTADREDRMVQGSADGIFMGDTKIQSYQWGWICVSGIKLLPLTDFFRNSLAGRKTLWMVNPRKHAGSAEFENGRLVLKTDAVQKDTGVGFRSDAKKIEVAPGIKFKFTVAAEGKGVLQTGFWAYSAKSKYLGQLQRSVKFRLKGKPETFSKEFTIPEGVSFIIPYIQTGANSNISISDFIIE